MFLNVFLRCEEDNIIMSFHAFREQVESLVGKEYETFLKKPAKEQADLCLLCFTIKEQPSSLAERFIKSVESGKRFNLIGKIEVQGPYINFFIKQDVFAKKIVEEIIDSEGCYGSKNKNKKTVVVEYSQPNTNKPLHIGHMRNDSIGMSISHILEYAGNNVIKCSILNDRGIHICKSMLAYKKWGGASTPKTAKKKSDHFVGDYYVLYEQKTKENEELQKEIGEMLRKWESGDREVLALWKKMNAWAIAGFKKTYKIYGSEFDTWFYESKIYKKARAIIDEGWAKSIFVKDPDGAIFAKLESHGLPNKYIIRSDGTSTYLAQDLPLAKIKFEKYKFEKSIHVVASEQNLYFKQLFKVLELLGYEWAKNCIHLSYGLVNLPSGKMKSREGTVVDADDLIKEITDLAHKEMKKRYPKLPEAEIKKRSLKIALAAIKYYFLKIETARDMLFVPNEAISFEGNTGPYLLYTYARCKSLLRKATKKMKTGKTTGKEFPLIKKLSQFPEVVDDAAQSLKPHMITNYLFELATLFNEYYHNEKIIGSENEESKLGLVKATSMVLKNGLHLLNIDTLEKM